MAKSKEEIKSHKYSELKAKCAKEAFKFWDESGPYTSLAGLYQFHICMRGVEALEKKSDRELTGDVQSYSSFSDE